jgi:acyl-CoA synthetase (AMP-forming)/AMP-acid ligase II
MRLDFLSADKLIAIGNAVIGTRHFGPGSSMQRLGDWSSLKHVQLLGKIAAEFGVDIELEDAYKLDSFERLMQHIESQLPQPTAARGGSEPTIGALFHARAQALPDDTFLIFPKEDQTYSYRAFHRLATGAAKRLTAQGLQRGDRLCVVFPNGPEFLAYYFGAHLLGVVLVPINPVLTATEAAYIIENCGARLALFDRQLRPMHDEIRSRSTSVSLAVADSAGAFGLEALRADTSSTLIETDPAVGIDDAAGILYTSGTTGNPKGVVLSHRNFLSDARALADWFDLDAGTRTMCILPMFHNNGQVITLLTPLAVGGSSVILEGKSALMSFWKLIDLHRVNWTSVMPAFLSAFLEFDLKRTDSTLQGIVCGGQVLLDEVRTRFETKYCVPVFEGFGLTETTSFSTMNRYPAPARRFGSIGVELPCNQLCIVDDEGQPVADGEIGEIIIRGDNVSSSYHALPEITAQRHHDGWLFTGDYGYRDAEGHFFFSTRLDDLIIKGGENVYPAEIENALHGCDEVVECAALGVPDAILGQEICLYVKLRPDSALSDEDIRQLFFARIARFKCPRHIVVLNRIESLTELPKGPTRKILRRKLREHFASMQEQVQKA